MKPINVLSLFDGMSAGRIALERAGIPVNQYYASELDKHAIKVSKTNWTDVVHIGDVTKVSYKDGVLHTENGDFNVGSIDLVIGGSPCQSFSRAGDGTGFDGKSGLFYEFLRVLREINPKHFLLENVRMKSQWKDLISEEMGVQPVEINSSLVSAQLRKRLYWSNISIEPINDCGVSIMDIVENFKSKTDSRLNSTLQINPSKKAGGTQPYYQDRVFHYTGKVHCLTTFGNGVWVGDYDESSWFKLSPEHHEKLQTVPVGYTSSVADSQRYKMLGNGWTVDIIAHILKGIKE